MIATPTVSFPNALKRSDIFLGPLLDPVSEVLLIGNGDVQATVRRTEKHVILNLSKNDIWDRRLDTSKDADLITTQELLDEIEKSSAEADAAGQADMSGSYSQQFARRVAELERSYNDHKYPSPISCALISITAPLSSSECNHLSLKDGVLYWHADAGRLCMFADANANGCVIEGVPDDMEIELVAVELDEVESAKTGKAEDISWIHQALPGDQDVTEMHFTVMLWRDRCHKAAYVSVAVAHEAAASDMEAAAIIESYKKCSFGEVINSHKNWWDNYWSMSGVQMEDHLLESAWYRALYFFACAVRSGKTTPALFMGLVDNYPMWHGDYHLNVNMQMIYWGCYAANHDEMGEPYDSFALYHLVRSIWLARRLFGVEGAYYNLTAFLDEPQDPGSCKSKNGRQYMCHLYSRTLGISAFVAQNLWRHYAYTRDMELLARIYPVLKMVSLFYVNWGRLYPTVSPEHWGITPYMRYNRNSTFDICMIKYILAAAIQAGKLLNVDEEECNHWAEFLSAMPPYPLSSGDNPVVVDVENAPPRSYNIPVPIYPVYPGEDIHACQSLREVFIRTIDTLKLDFYDPVTLSMAKIRLITEDAFDTFRLLTLRSLRPNGSMGVLPEFHEYNRFVYATQECGMMLPITELLLQSHGNVIRLFPAWKRELDASFKTLRAEGAFLISSGIHDGIVGDTVIQSLIGGQVSIVSEWKKPVITECDGTIVLCPVGIDGVITFETKRNGIYTISEETCDA